MGVVALVNCNPASAADVTVDVTGTLACTYCTPVIATGFIPSGFFPPTTFIRDTSIDDRGGNDVVTGVIFALIAAVMSSSALLGEAHIAAALLAGADHSIAASRYFPTKVGALVGGPGTGEIHFA